MSFPVSRKLTIGIVLASGALGLATWTAREVGKARERQLRAGVEEARREMSSGRLAEARAKLTALAGQWPDRGDVLLPLGQSEEALGHPEQALKAWEQVPASDPNYVPAVESLASVRINLGRFTPAESLLIKALREVPASDRYPLIRALARLLRMEGRFAEIGQVLIAGWGCAPNPSELLQDLWQNDTEPVAVDAWKLFLDAADDQDDRVWLGRAHHALESGRLDEAATWLDRCKSRRADDPAVARASLALAMASDDEARFREAANLIPAEDLSPSMVANLRVWLASRGGDLEAERRELSRLVEIQPSNTQALERLAVLAREAGDTGEAERLQRARAEIDRAKDYIHKLVVRKIEFRSVAGELARLSGLLGRHFDEHAWSLVAADSPGGKPSEATIGPSRTFCREASGSAMASLIAKSAGPRPSGTVMVADRLADLRASKIAGDGPTARPGESDLSAGPKLDFVDDAEAAGLRFVFDNGRTALTKWLLPESLSGGVGLIDFDGDGWLDVYCVQGGPLDAGGPDSGEPRVSLPDGELGDRLFRNQRDGTFRDATREAGIDRLAWGQGYGMGVSVGDVDNDGHPDLFLTRLNRYHLYRNRGDGTFEDATERSGLGGVQRNPTSSAFADLDGDGDLDLYVCHYVLWDPSDIPLCKNDQGQAYYCDPAKYERASDRVFRNDGGRFVDVTGSAGFTDPDGRGLGVVAADFDDDNKIDLYVANDGTANFLFHNLGGMSFEEIGMMAGVAANNEGGFQAGMGVAAADFDGDERMDLVVTNLYGEGTTLYQNLGQNMFADQSAPSGILLATRYLLGFGIAAFDAANDGRIDLTIANGNVNDFRPLYPNAMPARLYEGRPGGRLVDVSDRAGTPWAELRLGRGLAAGDLDNDGRVDFVAIDQNEPLAFFRNRTERAGHFATFQLEGTASNRDGVGARVVVTTPDGRRQVAQRLGGGSYLSASDGRLHFGLGASATIGSVEVRWPSGRLDLWKDLAGDTGYRLREGEPIPKPLAGFRAGP
ncbi:FG-GAP-like repeat-containing protein [Tundrisphaera lichenicola]|uniref:FG-GAP-like repeat-containing protein n=1 Tax=Tundrisphaera lichenicola TaxID=2029860 RepID=UPI003EB7AF43